MSGTTTPTASMMLEELRQRIRQEYAPPPASASERLAAFGRGVLSNRGSFLENLTAGLASQEQAAAARADQQRRALDMERQAVEQAVREQLERDRLAQSQSQFEAEGPVREARIRSYNAQAAQAGRPSYNVIGTTREGWAVIPDPNSPGGTRVLEGITPTQIAAAGIRSDSATLTRATTAGNQAIRDENRRREGLAQNPLTPAEAEEVFQRAFELARRSMQPGTPPSGQTGGTPSGPQPSRVIDYGGPQSQPGPRNAPRISAQPQ
jgi:hypothetical protein